MCSSDLARGHETPRITTGSLPALPDMPTLAVPPAHVPKPTKRRTIGYAAAVTVLLAVGGWLLGRTIGAPSAAAVSATPLRDSAPPPPAPAPAAPPAAPPAVVVIARPVTVATGKLRILTSPPSAEILVDGRRVGVGSVVDLRVPSGTRRLRVQAAGYAPWDTTIVVEAGATHSLGRVTLRAPGE